MTYNNIIILWQYKYGILYSMHDNNIRVLYNNDTILHTTIPYIYLDISIFHFLQKLWSYNRQNTNIDITFLCTLKNFIRIFPPFSLCLCRDRFKRIHLIMCRELKKEERKRKEHSWTVKSSENMYMYVQAKKFISESRFHFSLHVYFHVGTISIFDEKKKRRKKKKKKSKTHARKKKKKKEWHFSRPNSPGNQTPRHILAGERERAIDIDGARVSSERYSGAAF